MNKKKKPEIIPRIHVWYAINKLSSSNGLTSQEKLFLSVLSTFIDKDLNCNPTVGELADLLMVMPRTVHDTKRALKNKGWITWEPCTGKGNSNSYYINTKKLIDCMALTEYKMPEHLLPFSYQEVMFKDT